jgi:hypothetical protein
MYTLLIDNYEHVKLRTRNILLCRSKGRNIYEMVLSEYYINDLYTTTWVTAPEVRSLLTGGVALMSLEGKAPSLWLSGGHCLIRLLQRPIFCGLAK